MKPVVIFGNGQFADMLHFYFSTDSGRKIAGFTVDRTHLKEAHFCGLPVVPFEEVEKHFPPQQYDICVAIGYSKGNKFIDTLKVRKEKYFQAINKGYQFASYISSKAQIMHRDRIGQNTVILEGSWIMPYTTVGNNCILYWCGIGHHVHIADHVFMAGNVVIGGQTEVGEGALFGIGVTVANALKIGKQSVLGVGAVITHDVVDDAVYTVSNPARQRLLKSDKIRI